MRAVHHITTAAEWAAARADGTLRPPSLAAVGFVHLSARRQVLATANRWFTARRGLVLLTVDADALGDALVWEEGEPGEAFPHLYGPLPVGAVVGVAVLEPDGDGVFRDLPG